MMIVKGKGEGRRWKSDKGRWDLWRYRRTGSIKCEGGREGGDREIMER